MAKPNFGYQKRQKELEKKRKKEEKLKRKLDKNAAARGRRRAAAAPEHRRSDLIARRKALPAGGPPIRTEFGRHRSWPPTCSRSIPRSGTGRSLPRDIRTLARRGHLDTSWSCGRHRNIEPGSRAFLVRLGVPPKGIFGSGVTLTAPETGRHWIEEKAAAGITDELHDAAARALCSRLPLVTFDELTVPPFRRFRWGVRSSGTYLPETIADALEDLWEARAAAAATLRVEAPRPARSPPRRATVKPGR